MQAFAVVERKLGAQVNRTAGAAFDLVCRGRLVDIHRLHQFGRDIAPEQRTTRVGAEDLTTVQARCDAREAADLDARSFDRVVVGIVDRGEAYDGDARHALQDFGDRVVGQLAGVVGHHRIDDRDRVLLAVFCRFQCRAPAGDDNRIAFGGGRLTRSRLGDRLGHTGQRKHGQSDDARTRIEASFNHVPLLNACRRALLSTPPTDRLSLSRLFVGLGN